MNLAAARSVRLLNSIRSRLWLNLEFLRGEKGKLRGTVSTH